MVPARQFEQLEESLAPVVLKKVPDEQEMQLVDPVDA